MIKIIYIHIVLLSFFNHTVFSFEPPGKYSCEKFSSGQVCIHDDVIINITTKEREEKDSTARYKQYLSKPIINSKSISKVIDTKVVRVKNRNWVYAIHEGSEIPTYTTTYMVTAYAEKAIVVSFSTPKFLFKNKKQEIKTLVNLLKVNPPIF